jgi:hypothetical protein
VLGDEVPARRGFGEPLQAQRFVPGYALSLEIAGAQPVHGIHMTLLGRGREPRGRDGISAGSVEGEAQRISRRGVARIRLNDVLDELIVQLQRDSPFQAVQTHLPDDVRCPAPAGALCPGHGAFFSPAQDGTGRHPGQHRRGGGADSGSIQGGQHILQCACRRLRGGSAW